MLSSLLFAVAFAADCPDGEAAVTSAERDAVSYFIADAQTALAEATDAFACSKVDSVLLARYWMAQGMLWHLGEDDRFDAALAAARSLEPSLFTEDFGPELRAEWEAAERPPGDIVSIKVKGKAKNESVLVDGVLSEPTEALPGMHLIQIRRDGEIVFARLMMVKPGLTTTLDARTPGPSLAPQTTVVAGFEGPVSLKRGIRDASGERLDSFTLATSLGSTDDGLAALKRHRRSNLLQIPALTVSAAGLYGTYLSFWEIGVGDTLSRNQRTALLGTSLSALLGGVTWEVVLRAKRRGHRKRIVALANEPSP